MKSRLPLFLALSLAALPVQAAEEAVPQKQPSWLKRTAQAIWPFKKKEPKLKEEPGKTWKQLSPSISIEPTKIKLADLRTIKVTVHVTNKGKKLVQLDFPTSQRIEVLIKDSAGTMIEQWSEDQAFQNEPTLVTINPGERLEYVATVATRDLKAGGSYTVEGFFPNYDQLRASQLITPEP